MTHSQNTRGRSEKHVYHLQTPETESTANAATGGYYLQEIQLGHYACKLLDLDMQRVLGYVMSLRYVVTLRYITSLSCITLRYYVTWTAKREMKVSRPVVKLTAASV